METVGKGAEKLLSPVFLPFSVAGFLALFALTVISDKQRFVDCRLRCTYIRAALYPTFSPLHYSIRWVGSVVLGGGRCHVLDLEGGGLARPVKTSRFERPPSEEENIAAAESETTACFNQI